jgi:hypothetical protein
LLEEEQEIKIIPWKSLILITRPISATQRAIYVNSSTRAFLSPKAEATQLRRDNERELQHGRFYASRRLRHRAASGSYYQPQPESKRKGIHYYPRNERGRKSFELEVISYSFFLRLRFLASKHHEVGDLKLELLD